MTIRAVTAVLEGPVAVSARGDTTQTISARGDTTFAVTAVIDTGAVAPVDPPVLVSPPTIAGYVVPGQTLTATPAVYTGATSVTGQWLRAGVPIAGETGLTYDVVQADVLLDITYESTGTSAGGSTVSESDPALDAIDAYTSDPSHIDIWAALPETMSALDTGPLGGMLPGQLVQRLAGVIYGLAGPVLTQPSSGSRPLYDVVDGAPSIVCDGTNDTLIYEGSGLASRMTGAWACEQSETRLRSSLAQWSWGMALSTTNAPYVRVGAANETSGGVSSMRDTIRSDASVAQSVTYTSTRAPTGWPWAVRTSHRRAAAQLDITEVQPDSGTASDAVGDTPELDRLAIGAVPTASGVQAYCHVAVHALALWDTDTPTALSVAAARALMTHWGYP